MKIEVLDGSKQEEKTTTSGYRNILGRLSDVYTTFSYVPVSSALYVQPALDAVVDSLDWIIGALVYMGIASRKPSDENTVTDIAYSVVWPCIILLVTSAWVAYARTLKNQRAESIEPPCSCHLSCACSASGVVRNSGAMIKAVASSASGYLLLEEVMGSNAALSLTLGTFAGTVWAQVAFLSEKPEVEGEIKYTKDDEHIEHKEYELREDYVVVSDKTSESEVYYHHEDEQKNIYLHEEEHIRGTAVDVVSVTLPVYPSKNVERWSAYTTLAYVPANTALYFGPAVLVAKNAMQWMLAKVHDIKDAEKHATIIAYALVAPLTLTLLYSSTRSYYRYATDYYSRPKMKFSWRDIPALAGSLVKAVASARSGYVLLKQIPYVGRTGALVLTAFFAKGTVDAQLAFLSAEAKKEEKIKTRLSVAPSPHNPPTEAVNAQPATPLVNGAAHRNGYGAFLQPPPSPYIASGNRNSIRLNGTDESPPPHAAQKRSMGCGIG